MTRARDDRNRNARAEYWRGPAATVEEDTVHAAHAFTAAFAADRDRELAGVPRIELPPEQAVRLNEWFAAYQRQEDERREQWWAELRAGSGGSL